MAAGDDDNTAVAGSFRNARKSWTRTTRILGREGADSWISSLFFKLVVQAVFLFGLETWVLTPCMERALGSFQHRVVQWITGRQPRRQRERGWEYPPLTAAMEEAGFEEIRVYIKTRQNTVAPYIARRPILDLCEQSVRRLGAWVSWRWWEQEGIDLGGERGRDRRQRWAGMRRSAERKWCRRRRRTGAEGRGY